ncbi:hypothetical protein KMI_05g08070 [Encephalitozoon hellem]|uniref:Exportin n=1 Tax=Encephalitozoon hellem TaxID=27973 RepID=A0A9Q9C2W7_ENCHE|nr:uncharacterized protein EHEL_050190 [Encephalitozoon hellem ATCC 50504]AFM98230.1 hypothetical protein EHEL_050190 [Encephalitozoon hellem ATCC 50504]KAG5859625.1 hypothetical protein KMI_05g08070 [Encephalitozoon hellem]UTX43106.1 hypothetical protein GPU96_05g08450 [Encephalitozoon hellem]WEL38563.1 putative exportin [Encephalitozoon hellem]|eukprot:XP_003887211.1 hypothetical protein EHEL_050190 [Encephalitozoon hellem ATCC 50504]
MKSKRLLIASAFLLVIGLTIWYAIYNFYCLFMSDEAANSIFDKSKLRGKFEDSDKVIEGPDFFSFVYKFLLTLDDSVIGDSCVEGVYDKNSISEKESYLKDGLEMATKTLFKNRNVKKDLDEILGSSIFDIVETMKREGKAQESEGAVEGLKDNSHIVTMVSKAFIYTLLKERIDPLKYNVYLDKVRGDFNESTLEHLKRIGAYEKILVFQGESDFAMEIYDYLRIVMFSTSKLIPEGLAAVNN